MNLLRDIQEGAADDAIASHRPAQGQSLCQQVGRTGCWRLGRRELGGGYELAQELPQYRGPSKADVRGDVVGPFGSG